MFGTPWIPMTFVRSNRPHRIRSPRLGLGLVAFVWLLGPSATLVKGQDYSNAVGIPPFTTALPVENGFINALNGDLHLEIPLGSYPERAGRQFKAALMYDSNIWECPGGYCDPWNIPDGNGNFSYGSIKLGGWRLVTSAHAGRPHYTTFSKFCIIGRNNYGVGQITYENFSWVGPDGTTHAFPSILIIQPVPTPPFNCYPNGTPGGDQSAADGSGYHMYVANYTNIQVYAPDGTLVYNSPSYPDETTHDSNGNSYDNHFSNPQFRS